MSEAEAWLPSRAVDDALRIIEPLLCGAPEQAALDEELRSIAKATGSLIVGEELGTPDLRSEELRRTLEGFQGGLRVESVINGVCERGLRRRRRS